MIRPALHLSAGTSKNNPFPLFFLKYLSPMPISHSEILNPRTPSRTCRTIVTVTHETKRENVKMQNKPAQHGVPMSRRQAPTRMRHVFELWDPPGGWSPSSARRRSFLVQLQQGPADNMHGRAGASCIHKVGSFSRSASREQSCQYGDASFLAEGLEEACGRFRNSPYHITHVGTYIPLRMM